ncbi:hypothetical protein V5N11_027384 [Cardamine amara subsp. amara]|uniref:DUF1618 domain-containing protein n=1 Tax=Cardamine amara subsp. amara TaxID=228776 RepID=A0ABD1BJG7_CARAN
MSNASVSPTPLSPSKLVLYIFDSMSSQWRYSYIEHPPWSEYGWCPTQRQALNLNGSLHWLAHDGPIVAYNPTKRLECIFIHRLQEMRHASYGDRAVVSETLAISKGHLRIIQLVCYPFPEDHHHLRTWTLVDYTKSIWKQEHDPLYFRDMVSGHQWIQDYMRGYNLATTDKHSMSFSMSIFMRTEASRHRIICPQPLHCHPNNPLLVYLYLSESIVSLDVITKKLSLITRVSKKGQRSHYWNKFDKVTRMTLELDPSLIPDHESVLLPRP